MRKLIGSSINRIVLGVQEVSDGTAETMPTELTQQESSDEITQKEKREYVAVDTFVHAFCKLFGQKGTPEYGQGVSFQDYVSSELDKATSAGDTTRLD